MGVKSQSLFELFVQLSGLNRSQVEEELQHLFVTHNLNPENMTMEQIRELMLIYLSEQKVVLNNENENDEFLNGFPLKFFPMVQA